MSRSPIVFVAHDYKTFCGALNAWRVELRVSAGDVDEAAGLKRGTFAKKISHQRAGNGGGVLQPCFLDPILHALGTGIRLVPNNGSHREPEELSTTNLDRLKANAAKGGRARMAMMTRGGKRRFFRALAVKRWARVKGRG
ncbi:MAG: hypothetical protein M3Z96_13010 [Pseudomonadota bacterium]|nr:hypothetical protein [Pseudomonadota bacterium]